MYKIINPDTGLFSTGGMTPSWSKTGKIWSHRGHVTSHLSQFSERDKQTYYSNCKVVEYELVECDEEVNVLSWKELPKTTRAKELAEERRLEFQKQRAAKQIKQLEAKLQELKNV